MAGRFTVLASGSGGNVSLLEAGDFGLLVDIGLGPRQIAARLEAAGASWDRVRAVVLTHVHNDHWNERTLAQLVRRRIPLYCHEGHVRTLESCSESWGELRAARLVRGYAAEQGFAVTSGLRCRAIELRHDGGRTFGFRFEAGGDLFSRAWAVAYVADLGSWDERLGEHLANVDLLALEFNHDPEMESASGRARRLIRRVMGDDGHLSNQQAAGLLRHVIERSRRERPQHVVQLHLSRECNRPALARRAAREVLAATCVEAELHTARQDRPIASVQLGGRVAQRMSAVSLA